MELIWNEIIPFKGINYFKELIKNYYPTEKENYKMYYQSKKIKLFYCVLSLKIIHLIYLTIFFNPTTYDELLIHFDFVRIANIPYMNGFSVFLILMFTYYLHLLYFNFDNPVMKMMNSIIILQKNSFFIEKHYKNIPMCNYLHNVVFIIMNFCQVFIIAIGIRTL